LTATMPSTKVRLVQRNIGARMRWLLYKLLVVWLIKQQRYVHQVCRLNLRRFVCAALVCRYHSLPSAVLVLGHMPCLRVFSLQLPAHPHFPSAPLVRAHCVPTRKLLSRGYSFKPALRCSLAVLSYFPLTRIAIVFYQPCTYCKCFAATVSISHSICLAPLCCSGQACPPAWPICLLLLWRF
jgi:hypothetical protein